MSPTGDDLDLSELMAQVTQLMAQQAPERTCALRGCTRKHYGRGLCKTHYMRQIRTGSPGPAAIAARSAREATCTVPGCDQPHEARGWCRTHYSRWRRTGDVHADIPRAPRRCRLPGCEQPHHRQGLCRTHFRRAQQTDGTQPAFDLPEAARLYRDGASAASLARLFGLTPHTVLARLRAAGVQIRLPGRQPRGDASAPTNPRQPSTPTTTSSQT